MTFPKTELYTDADGYARFRDSAIPLLEGDAVTRLSAPFAATGYQLRQSAVGFQSAFHCTTAPQWTFILKGKMEILLRDGSSRIFGAGEGFYSNDLLPEGATFDPARHGHWSRQLGEEPLVTLFLKE
ncbi:MAG: hypothetical protein LBS89_02280 [Zoogloeaceae bacterium]|jgi:hypothetical protein|nr:hypothetical protein [Zoogloeaceae bacterium]